MMRRSDRQVTEFSEQLQILSSCKVLRLAMIAEGKPYVVPLNFGYDFNGKNLTLYIHSAKEGKKIDAMKQNGEVCFETDCMHSITEGEKACDYGCLFSSVIGWGKACFVTSEEDKFYALQKIMEHQTGKSDFTFRKETVEKTCIIKVVSNAFTFKSRAK